MFNYKRLSVVLVVVIIGIFIYVCDNYNFDNSLVVSSEFVEDITVIEDDFFKPIVFDGLTMEELITKLNRNLYNELSNKGELYARYSIEKGVDPYLAVAISLEETGCKWGCSGLVKYCNNVGGMIGSGCEGFSRWSSLDEGIMAFIDNIYINYVRYGLLDATHMGPKYAENPLWSTNVNRYYQIIKNN